MNNKDFNNKIKQAFDYTKRNHSFVSFESLVNYYGEQSREDFNNLLEFSYYNDYNYIEKFKNNLYNAFEIDIPENMDETDKVNFDIALDKVENGFYLKKEKCYILDF